MFHTGSCILITCSINLAVACTMYKGKILCFKIAGEGTGLLRLHSTYRHDLKIYSSDEGRVQVWPKVVLTLIIRRLSGFHYWLLHFYTFWKCLMSRHCL